MSAAEKVLVHVRVNGEPREALVEPRTLLVDLLREHFNLTGTHIGCDTTYCGACTVLLNGRTTKSCTLFAPMAEGGEIVTVEGLSRSEEHTSELQSHRDLHSFPTRRSSDLLRCLHCSAEWPHHKILHAVRADGRGRRNRHRRRTFQKRRIASRPTGVC